MVLKANDCRYGNYIIYGGSITQLNEKEMCHFFRFPESYKPIPLTEEWLLKFGFRHVMNNWYNIFVNGNTFNAYIFEDGRYRIEIVSQSIGVFEFIHNLQNLYFVLTNEELEIKM